MNCSARTVTRDHSYRINATEDNNTLSDTQACEFFPPVLKIWVSTSLEQELSHVEGGGGGEGGEAVVERGVPVITGGDYSSNMKL